MRDITGYTYRYEMHCHTNCCSRCAHSSPREMVDAYLKAGYSGMVITDHYLLGNSAVDRSLPWEEQMRCYYDAYLEAKNYAQTKSPDFHVLFGLEHQYGSGKEVLTYGIDLEFLLAHPSLHLYELEDYVAAVRQAGGFISMAHPYRCAPYIDEAVKPRPECLDGAEIFNFFNTEEENRQAAKLAERYHLAPTSGGDVHRDDESAIGMAGLAFAVPVETNEQLVTLLKKREYRIIINGKIV